jgi:hypothetical protein
LGGDADGGVKAQIFNAAGAKVGGEFLVNTTTSGVQDMPTVAALASGGFVVAWEDASGLGGDARGTGIKAQVFSAAGAKIGSELLVNTTTALDQTAPSIAPMSSGGFVVAWQDMSGLDGDASGASIKAQMYDVNGATLGGEFLINGTTAGDQFGPTIASLGLDRFVVAWGDASGLAGDASGFATEARIFNAGNSPPVIASDGGGATAALSIAENGTAVTTVTASDPNPNTTLHYAITGGDDAALFQIDADTGVLRFINAPDYEAPADADHDNVYKLTVAASDGNLSDSQDIAVSVTNVSETHNLTLTNGNDTFVTSSNDDFNINALQGDDVITTAGGHDTVCGGAGNDVISTGANDDTITYAGTGNGADTVDGGDGNDAIDGGAGFDTIQASAANATLNWGSIANVEAISGGGFAGVKILGSAAANVMDFSNIALSDIATINGAGGGDTITGSAGADVFGYAAVADSRASTGIDVINGFQDGIDRIDLSAIDASTKAAGNQAFTFIGSGGFTGVAGQLRVDTGVAGTTDILADVNGDRLADLTIHLTGTHALTSGDFIL